jgi:hypothetical protein
LEKEGVALAKPPGWLRFGEGVFIEGMAAPQSLGLQ